MAAPSEPAQPRGDPPSLAGAPWLAAAHTQRVLAMLAAGGFEARVVGGTVRNALMGLPVTDIDIATTALPADVMRLAAAAGLGAVPTGIDHGTVTVIAEHRAIEVTTLRRDVESHGRHATVAFTRDWLADASRRDFTMNALYCDAGGSVFDPIGGWPDLIARRVRFIGDAGERIREDYLRILRFFRFTAQYGDGHPEPSGLTAAVRERDGLARLSGERIRQELVKLLTAANVLPAIAAMHDRGLLSELLAVAPRPRLLERATLIEAACGLAADAMLRLAALGVEVEEDSARLALRLRLSADERTALEQAAGQAARLETAPGEPAAKAMLYALGPAAYRRQIALSWARALAAGTADAAWSAALQLPERWARPQFPLRGADVLGRGVPAGPRVGEVLRKLEAEWIAGGFAGSREELLTRLAAELA